MNTVNKYSIEEFLGSQSGEACDGLVVLLTENTATHHGTNRAKLVSFDGQVFHYDNVRFYTNQVESVIVLSDENIVQDTPQLDLLEDSHDTDKEEHEAAAPPAEPQSPPAAPAVQPSAIAQALSKAQPARKGR